MSNSHYRFLYIDDNEGLSTEEIQSRYHHNFSNVTLEHVLTNEQALEKIASHFYDVIFYDLGMDKDLRYPIAHLIKDRKPSAILVGISYALLFNSDLPICFDARMASLIASNYPDTVANVVRKYNILLKK
ncbi:hypothetical protein HYX11_04565 [Candidatus Woesearchaeota archaeon]|nr:hypothetical protein [Candidatus Woesearchaeota archaeon]